MKRRPGRPRKIRADLYVRGERGWRGWQLPEAIRTQAEAERWDFTAVFDWWAALFLQYWAGHPVSTGLAMRRDGWDRVPGPEKLWMLRNREDVAFQIQKIDVDTEYGENGDIADEREIQMFWTSVMRNQNEPTAMRKASSETLGRSKGMFADNLNVRGIGGFDIAGILREIHESRQNGNGQCQSLEDQG